MSLENLIGRKALFDEKYRIIGIIGKGSTGGVYLAENCKLGTLWAIKEKSKARAAAHDVYAEVEILKKLDHPAIPRIYDVVEDDENIYIIRDYVAGTPLDRELEAAGRFPERQVLDWALQLCDVLAYLHSAKPNPIIYRDLKPSNILLSKDNRIKLVDFSAAREYKDLADCDTVYLGTRGYAAPEQYGSGQTDPATDIYGLGITLYQLVTGKRPEVTNFEAANFGGMDEGSADLFGIRVGYIETGLSPGFEAVILRCTRLQPSERYQSVEELREDLKKLLEPDARQGAVEEPDSSRRKVVSFRRLVLSVWDNPEFACELAYMANKLAGLRVLIITPDEHRHAVVPRLGLSNADLKGKFYDITELGFDDAGFFETLTEVEKDLYLLCLPSDKFQAEMQRQLAESAINYAYRHFDITVAALRRCLCTARDIFLFRKSDFVIIADTADLNTLLEWSGEIRLLKAVCGLQPEKIKFVAYEYKKDINLSAGFFKNFFGQDCCIGCVSYSRDREICRNSGTVFAKSLVHKYPDEYREILSCFGIFPRPGFRARIAEWLKKQLFINQYRKR